MAMLFSTLLAAVAASAAQPAGATPDFDRANQAHMDSMDAYFACAFAAIRESRAEGLGADGFLATHDRNCAREAELLRQRTETFLRARGMSAATARAKAREELAAARRDLTRTYSGQ